MKNISRISMILCTIILLNSNAIAQSIGVIIQPEFNTDNTRRGLFIESPVYKSIGVYSDFKVLKNVHNGEQYNYRQLNVGLSLKVKENITAIATTSIINTLAVDKRQPLSLHGIIRGNYKDQERTYQLGILYKVEFLSILGAYEFNDKMNNPRVTIGVGFNFGHIYK